MPLALPKKTKTPRSFPLAWRGLPIQLFLVAILPLTALLLILTFGSLSIHQRAMRTLVADRDQRAVRTAAGAIDDQVRQRVNVLKLLSASASATASATASALPPGLTGADFVKEDFDYGLAAFAANGSLHVYQGDGASAQSGIWQALADPLRQAALTLLADPQTDVGVLSEFTDPQTGKRLVIILAASPDRQAVIAGGLSTASLVGSVIDDALAAGQHASYLLIDRSGQTVEAAGHILVDSNSPGHPGVAEALRGESGTAYFPAADTEHVVAYSPIRSLGWALLSEEPWEMVDTPTLRFTQLAPLILAPVLLLALLALWFGARQIVRPLQQLEDRSSRLAQGDFEAISEPVGGISEIRQLQSELVNMARRVEASQESLHGYIGAITAAQEDERRRLARELHDDTIQSLIALKQRIQIARFNLVEERRTSPEAQALDELANLAEETITNLRRVTRGLRPIYLEDLGLAPALEMLGRETSLAAAIPVEFKRLGDVRRLDSAVELALYRMAQEVLSNIARHAEAAQAELSIEFLPTEVVLTISDDGVSFAVPSDPAEFAQQGHYGLLGIHERAELIGADLQIRSNPGQGTQLRISISDAAWNSVQAI